MYRDADKDGFGRPGITFQSCTQPIGYVSLSTDCNDNDRNTYPNAPELPDGKDNDCDGQIDEGVECSIIWYRDADKDGYGRPSITFLSCTQPQGYVSQSTDCNDNDRNTYPNAPELPDGQDNNCNGQIDEGMPCRTVWYRDADGDGFGRPSITFLSCTQPIGYVSQSTDCNDNDRTVYPNAPELCDGKDNNCNGTKDEGCNAPTKAFTKSLETKPKQNLKSLEELSVNVWPNPAKDVLMVSIDAFAANQKVAIILLQMDGKPVASKSIVPDAKGKQVRFDVSTMAAGYYILQVKQGTQSQIKKVMISK